MMHRINALSYSDTEMLLKIWQRVGRETFTVRDICDIMPRGFTARFRAAGVIQTTGKELRVHVWKIRPDIATRFEEYDSRRVKE